MSVANTHTKYDIIVIGAGVAGLSVAGFLSRGAKVAVLERESQPAYHSSGRSAAMFIESYENPIVSGLTSAGKVFFFSPPQEWCGETGQSTLVTPCGGLTAAGPGEANALQDYLRRWQPLCPDLVEISPAQCREKIPILKANWLQAAAYDPSWHAIDVHELLTVYQRGIKAGGGHVFTNCAVNKLTYNNRSWLVDTPRGVLVANLIVNAAGAWANRIAALAGTAEIPLTPMRRTAAIIPPVDDPAYQQWPLLHTLSEDLYFKPESPGLMICPQDETPTEPMDAYPMELDVAVAVARFTEITNHPVQRVLHQWAGLRTFARDRLPVVGFDPALSNFYWLAGQGGYGVQTSPGLAEVVSAEILNHTPHDPAISVQRF